MKIYAYIIFGLLITVLTNCNKKSKGIIFVKPLISKGYQRQFSEKFNYTPSLSDAQEELYYMKFLRTHKREEHEAFFYLPNIKDTINLQVGFEQIRTPYCKDTIDVYINNELLCAGEYPPNPQCQIYYPKLPRFVNCNYYNHQKLKEASILLVFHNEKVYFDTIIPLRFKRILITHPGFGFAFKFEKALD